MTDFTSSPPPSPIERLRPFLLTRRVQFLLDVAVLSSTFVLAYLLRFDFEIPSSYFERLLIQLPLVAVIQISALFLNGVYSFIWRYVGLRELGAFARAALFSALPILGLRLLLPESLQDWRVPLSVIIMDTILAFGGLVGLRVCRRLFYEWEEGSRRASGESVRRPVLLVGAGRAGVLALREIQGHGSRGLEVIGFVDDDPLKQATVIYGARVLGTTRHLPELLAQFRIEEVIITIAEIRREQMRRIVETCDRAGVRVRSMPALFEILQGKVEISRFRDVRVEDLLDRDPVDLGRDRPASVFAGQRVLITGAGGSIGAELTRQLARLQPARLLLVERSENALFEIHRELIELWPDLGLDALVADAGDQPRMAAIFDREQPDVVFHAAAHKHVPVMEANPGEAIKNNVLATHSLGTLAGRYGCERFVLISTDKAVNPSSVMGASKRVAELVVQRLDGLYATRYLAVRFGNVLGSAGSVLPIFRQQIAQGGPVTVTHPDMVRYFMTIPEAVHLVLEAGAMGEGGEIFILDMGEPIRILDLARKLIRLSALEPDQDIPIVFTGLRPGEKLFEELAVHGESIAKTRHPKIFTGRISGPPAEAVERALDELARLSRDGDGAGVRAFLSELLPEAQLQGVAGGLSTPVRS